MCLLMKRLHALSFAAIGCIAVSVIAIAAAPTSARAQSADLVLCDRLAADPPIRTSRRMSKARPDVAPSDLATAIKYCRISRRLVAKALYSARRAYAANRQLPEAIGAWRKAADKGSTSAMVELGVALRQRLRRGPRRGPGAQLFRARRGKPAIRAASPILPRCPWRRRAGGSREKRGSCWRKAAETNAEAQYQLGLMMEDGTGGPADDAAARALFEKAARAKSPRRAGADGRVRPKRARRSEGFGRRESLLRKIRGARQSGRQESA